MIDAEEPKPKKLQSVGDLTADSLRKSAAAARGVASALYLAEMSADWPAVAAVRAMLIETSLELEGLAIKARERS